MILTIIKLTEEEKNLLINSVSFSLEKLQHEKGVQDKLKVMKSYQSILNKLRGREPVKWVQQRNT